MHLIEAENSLPIGGYFELELPRTSTTFFSGFRKFQSARAAFSALLKTGNPKRVWVPKYICDAMLTPLINLEIEHIFYDLNDVLDISTSIELQAEDWLLYVNYFGICSQKVNSLLDRFNPEQIVLDYSQAFFAPLHHHVLATIYSPRKFFGVPDGGLLHSQLLIPQCAGTDTSSFSRMEHLLQRLGSSPEAGFAAYQRAEKCLDDLSEPKQMSLLSERILSSIDFDAVQEKRKENFQTLHHLLKNSDPLLEEINTMDTPLCYPYFSSDDALRQHLIKNKIFIATYWHDAGMRLDAKISDRFIRNMLPLPIDQRYGTTDMERIASIIKQQNHIL